MSGWSGAVREGIKWVLKVKSCVKGVYPGGRARLGGGGEAGEGGAKVEMSLRDKKEGKWMVEGLPGFVGGCRGLSGG